MLSHEINLMNRPFLVKSGGEKLSEELLMACKELIDHAKIEHKNIAFKQACIKILAEAKHILTNEQFKELCTYAAERIKEKIEPE